MALAIAAYAFSPVDLIPDFIPVLGLLDDLILLPLGIWVVLKLVPAPLMAIFRREAEELAERPRSVAGLVLVIFVWSAALLLAGWWFLRLARD